MFVYRGILRGPLVLVQLMIIRASGIGFRWAGRQQCYDRSKVPRLCRHEQIYNNILKPFEAIFDNFMCFFFFFLYIFFIFLTYLGFAHELTVLSCKRVELTGRKIKRVEAHQSQPIVP